MNPGNDPPKKTTSREQASHIKKKYIHDKAMELFSVHGFSRTTIADISKATGMSIGSIYHYYENKEAILLEIFSEVGRAKKLGNVERAAKKPYTALYNNLIASTKTWERIGVELTKHIYFAFERISPSPCQTLKMLVPHEQFMQLITAAQNAGTFDTDISAEKACEQIFTYYRGIVFEWIICNGTTGLTKTTREKMPRFLKTFMIE